MNKRCSIGPKCHTNRRRYGFLHGISYGMKSLWDTPPHTNQNTLGKDCNEPYSNNQTVINIQQYLSM